MKSSLLNFYSNENQGLSGIDVVNSRLAEASKKNENELEYQMIVIAMVLVFILICYFLYFFYQNSNNIFEKRAYKNVITGTQRERNPRNKKRRIKFSSNYISRTLIK